MMRRIALAALLALLPAIASAQMALIAPDLPAADNSDRIANSRFVESEISRNTTHFAAGGTATCIGNALTIASVSPPVFSFTGNPTVTFTAGCSPNGATTLNVAASGVKSVVRKTAGGLVALVTNDIINGQQYLATYDGTQYQLQTPSSLLPSSASALGGVTSATAPANQFQTGISTAGAPTFAQPSFANLSGSLGAGQLGAGVDTNISTAKTGNYTAANADCGAPLLLGGNAQFTLTVNAANTYTANCHLILINTDTYSGVGSGRGKILAVNGLTTHVLYPGQKLDLRQNGTSWVTDQQIAGSFGQVWQAASAVNFFIDTGGSDSNNDGLASGASGSFASLSKCGTQAYSVVYTRNEGSVFCSVTAAQNISSFVQVFYPMNGGGTLIFNSATPGSQWTWTCPVSSYCLQFGDGALVGFADTKFQTNPSSLAAITGHNHGVLDLNTNILFSMNTGQPLMTCDFDTHFNINNGFTYSNAASFLFSGCQGSRWNINGAINTSGSVTLGRLFNFTAGSLASFAGNVTWGTAGLSTSVGLVSGNSVLNNAAGALPGGAPTPTTGGQYCTSAC